MELLIAAGIPSAIVAFCFWLLEKRIQERAEVEKNERACRQREQDGLKNPIGVPFGDFAVSAGLHLGHPDIVPDGR